MARRTILAAMGVALLWVGPTAAQIVPPGAVPARLTPSNFVVGGIAIRFTEGPLYDGNGGVLFTDLHTASTPVTDPSRILRYDIATGVTSVVDSLSGGSNGLYRDGVGHIFSADRDGGKAGQVRQISRRSTTNVSVVEAALATGFNGGVFNGPNDLVVDAAGGIYFTDPDYDGRGQVQALYYRDPQGTLTRPRSSLNRPNGVVLSPDGHTLYLAIEGLRRIMAYDVAADGTLSNDRTFATMSSPHSPDGLTIDPAGNIYAAVSRAVWAWNPAGTKLFELAIPVISPATTAEDPTNVDIGGADGKTLFITAGRSLYGVHLNIATPATGDYNGNGVVDAADYTVWRDTLGSTSYFAADGDGNHVVDQADYDWWSNLFAGAGSGAAVAVGEVANVPEPSSLLLLTLIGMVGFCVRRRRKECTDRMG